LHEDTCLLYLPTINTIKQRHFQQYISYAMATSFSGGKSQREPPTMGKQLVNFITCVAIRVHPFCNLQSRAGTHALLVIGLYEL
jgi:hypothetical protein